MTTPLLQVQDIVGGYRPDLPILNGLSIDVTPGEVVTIVGPNGAGKSTLIKAVAGLVSVSAGSVTFEGRDITNIAPHDLVSAGIGYVPQTENVFTSLTIQENLRIGAHTMRGDMRPHFARIYDLFPLLAERRDHRARTLSGGQRQMLATARALLTEPRLIMLDEPSAGLAPMMVGGVFDMVRGLADTGVAVLMVEQNVKAALAMSDRGYVLAEGREQLSGPAADVLADPDLGAIFLGDKRRAA